MPPRSVPWWLIFVAIVLVHLDSRWVRRFISLQSIVRYQSCYSRFIDRLLIGIRVLDQVDTWFVVSSNVRLFDATLTNKGSSLDLVVYLLHYHRALDYFDWHYFEVKVAKWWDRFRSDFIVTYASESGGCWLWFNLNILNHPPFFLRFIWSWRWQQTSITPLSLTILEVKHTINLNLIFQSLLFDLLVDLLCASNPFCIL